MEPEQALSFYGLNYLIIFAYLIVVCIRANIGNGSHQPCSDILSILAHNLPIVLRIHRCHGIQESVRFNFEFSHEFVTDSAECLIGQTFECFRAH